MPVLFQAWAICEDCGGMVGAQVTVGNPDHVDAPEGWVVTTGGVDVATARCPECVAKEQAAAVPAEPKPQPQP